MEYETGPPKKIETQWEKSLSFRRELVFVFVCIACQWIRRILYWLDWFHSTEMVSCLLLLSTFLSYTGDTVLSYRLRLIYGCVVGSVWEKNTKKQTNQRCKFPTIKIYQYSFLLSYYSYRLYNWWGFIFLTLDG